MRMILAASLLPLITNCVSLSSYHSARPLRQGNTSTFFGVGSTSIKYLDKKDDDAATTEAKDTVESISLPIIEGGMRYGLGNNMEIGGKVTAPGSIGGDFKYTLLNGESLAVAAGAGLTYTSYSSGSDDDKIETTLFDIAVPIYLSYDLADWSSIYLGPRYILRSSNTKRASDAAESSAISLIGASVGINLGPFVVEAGYFMEPGADAGIQQITIGYSDHYQNVERPSRGDRKGKSKDKMSTSDEPAEEE